MADQVGIRLDHMAPGPVIRQRIIDQLGFASVGDDAAMDAMYRDPDLAENQSVFVLFRGEATEGADPRNGIGLNHIWFTCLAQRTDYDGWETAYGATRARLVCELSGWQPGPDLHPLELVPGFCQFQPLVGLNIDCLAWRVAQQHFLGDEL